MPENIFSPKMKGKSKSQLKAIMDSKDYVPEARQAAQWALESWGKSPVKKGESVYEDFLNSLECPNEHADGKNYQEFLKVELDNKSILKLAEKVFLKLQWTIIQLEEKVVMAARRDSAKKHEEMIGFLVSPKDEMIVYSQTWDAPRFRKKSHRNYQTVKLAIHVFHEIMKSKRT
ncbi:MAG: hypothetical protein HEP71_06070 [Roseivirga sp.]|nr:hypothetical protein [Roseivirga sp.]